MSPPVLPVGVHLSLSFLESCHFGWVWIWTVLSGVFHTLTVALFVFKVRTNAKITLPDSFLGVAISSTTSTSSPTSSTSATSLHSGNEGPDGVDLLGVQVLVFLQCCQECSRGLAGVAVSGVVLVVGLPRVLELRHGGLRHLEALLGVLGGGVKLQVDCDDLGVCVGEVGLPE